MVSVLNITQEDGIEKDDKLDLSVGDVCLRVA